MAITAMQNERMSALNVRTQILLTKEQMNYLAKLKKETGKSAGYWIREAIDQHARERIWDYETRIRSYNKPH